MRFLRKLHTNGELQEGNSSSPDSEQFAVLMTDAARHCSAEPQVNRWREAYQSRPMGGDTLGQVSMSHRGGLVKADVDDTGIEGGNLNDARRPIEKFQVKAGLANAARGLFARTVCGCFFMAYVCVAWSTGAGSGVPLCSLVRADAAQWIFGSSTCSVMPDDVVLIEKQQRRKLRAACVSKPSSLMSLKDSYQERESSPTGWI